MTAPSRRAADARARDAATLPPFESPHPPSLEQLLQGHPPHVDPATDLAAWAREVLDHPSVLPLDIQRLLTVALEQPTDDNVVPVADALERASDAQDRHLLDLGRLGALAERARISAGLLGDPHSCLLTAHLAGELAHTCPEDHIARRYLVTQRTFHLCAGYIAAGSDSIDLPLLSRIRARAAIDVAMAADIVQLFKDVGGEVQDDTGWVLDDAEEAWALPLRSEPGLVVLRSVEHLPGSSRDGGKPSSASTPRSEWAPLAGVRLPLRPVPDLAGVRAVLTSEFPDFVEAIDIILRDLAGRPHVHLRASLLVGPPGAGKTRFTRRLFEELDLPVTVYGCAAVSDGSFIGTSRQWGTGRASVPLQTIKRFGTASVGIVLDEIEKVGTRRENGSLLDGLLPMLEPEGAARYFDPFLECDTDLSATSFLATANSLDGVMSPLLDRLRIIRLPAPTAASLPPLTRGILEGLRRERGMDDLWLPDLLPDEAALVKRAWSGGSVRRLQRIIETVIAGRETLAPRH